jgi:hypothetical protein
MLCPLKVPESEAKKCPSNFPVNFALSLVLLKTELVSFAKSFENLYID